MASVSTDDRNVLFGLIALRAEVVTPRELWPRRWKAGCRTRQIGVADRLIQQGVLRADRRAWIEAMVEVELETPEQRRRTPSDVDAETARLRRPRRASRR